MAGRRVLGSGEGCDVWRGGGVVAVPGDGAPPREWRSSSRFATARATRSSAAGSAATSNCFASCLRYSSSLRSERCTCGYGGGGDGSGALSG